MKFPTALILFSILSISGCARAAPGCGDEAVMYSIDEDGRKVELVLSSTAMLGTKEWVPGRGEPPLSISKATQLAKDWAKKRYSRFDRVDIDQIALVRFTCSTVSNRWYYRFDFTPVIDGSHSFGSGNWAAVLMDGTVIGTRIAK